MDEKTYLNRVWWTTKENTKPNPSREHKPNPGYKLKHTRGINRSMQVCKMQTNELSTISGDIRIQKNAPNLENTKNQTYWA